MGNKLENIINNEKGNVVNGATSSIWIDGMMGLVMGDVLGMPVQFVDRKLLKANPVVEVEGYGTYNMPPGTWSDDSSIAIATLDSIRENKGIDYDDIMVRFVKWTLEGQYTPAGMAFDQGATCMEAIINYAKYKDYKTCGKTGEWANGNGALMRIMPVCLYAYVQHKNGKIKLEEAVEYVHEVSALTHNHMRSKIGCGIYFFMVKSILDEEGTLMDRLQKGMDSVKLFYKSDVRNLVEWSMYGRLKDLSEFAKVPENEIKSSGYVVDSLEAAVWSLITTKSFEEGLLCAVNLGDDADTVGAIAGGLAGLYYGYENIPVEWRKTIIKGKEIIALCELIEEEYYVR